MSFTLVSSTGRATGATGGITNSISTIGAKIIVIHEVSSVGLSTVSDSMGNAWISIPAQNNASASTIWFCLNPITSATHRFSTGNAINQYSCIHVQSFGAAGAVSLDAQTGSIINASSITNGSITPSRVNDLFVVGVSGQASFVSTTINGGFIITNQEAGVAATNYGGAMAYLIGSGFTAQNPTWNTTGSASNASVMAAFKDGGAVLPALSRAAIRVGPWTTPK